MESELKFALIITASIFAVLISYGLVAITH
ncbi:YnhF family membrane protein [Vibrio sp. SCSIO 43135]|nr:YnhF family membrane protein [Vibrio sp. SCSIO 43135]USD41984.1 YnhF family membrane protein [Vibrio sp. SCSIO 43135]